MKRKLYTLSAILLLGMATIGVKAQALTDLFTITHLKGGLFTLKIAGTAGTTLTIDWGDEGLSNLTLDGTLVSGTHRYSLLLPGQEPTQKVIKIKGVASAATAITQIECLTSSITDITVRKLTNLTSLNLENNKLTAIDVSKNTLLQTLLLTNNQLGTIDVSSLTELKILKVGDNNLNLLNIRNCAKLETLVGENNEISAFTLPDVRTSLKSVNMRNNKLGSAYSWMYYTNLVTLDVSGNSLYTLNLMNCSKLRELYIQDNKVSSVLFPTDATYLDVINCANNKLETLSLPQMLNLTELYCQGNLLTEITLYSNVPLMKLNCSDNKLLFSKIPAKPTNCNIGNYIYAPQKPYVVGKDFEGGRSIDITAFRTSTLGIFAGTENAPSVNFKWYYADGSEVPADKYMIENDKCYFLPVDVPADSVFLSIENNAFPVTAANKFRTTNVKISQPEPVLSVRISTPAEGEVPGSVVVPNSKIEMLTTNRATYYYALQVLVPVKPKPTILTTDKGEIESFTLSGRGTVSTLIKRIPLLEAAATYNLSVYALRDIAQAENITSISFSGFTVGQIFQMDITKLSGLRNLSVGPGILSSLDLSGQAADQLSTISVIKNNLTELDLSKFTGIKEIECDQNLLTSLRMNDNAAPTMMNLANNELENFPVNFDMSRLTRLNIKGNYLTPVTLPDKPAGCDVANFLYAPQKEYHLPVSEVTCNDDEVDISELAVPKKGVTSVWNIPSFVWLQSDGSAVPLAYYTTSNIGKYTFNKVLTDIYCVVQTAAYPEFTGTNQFKTTRLAVKESTGVDGIIVTDEPSLQIYVSSGAIVIDAVKGTAIRIVSGSGAFAREMRVQAGKTILNDMPRGFYIINGIKIVL